MSNPFTHDYPRSYEFAEPGRLLDESERQMKASRSFTVRPHVPEELSSLDTLARNLRWSWDRPTRDLLRTLDANLWETGGHDPLSLLAEVTPARLEELAVDESYLQRLNDSTESLSHYLSADLWFQEQIGASGPRTVAYFSPEFGISEAVPQYSGGLGVLAGDHLKTCSDLGVPLVGIGLFYRHGYFRQSLSVDGWQQERFPDLDPHSMALELCEGVRIDLELADTVLHAQVWKANVGRVPLYLLDTDIPENPEHLQTITDRLYGGDTEHRLRQEMLLGIGGVRALVALGIDADVFHTNEGHAGFLGLERIRMLMDSSGLSLAEAMEAVRGGAVFTTHTPVPAGIDKFPRELIEKYFQGWAQRCGIEIDDLMALGHGPGESAGEPFNMAIMGMHLAEFRNGVSKLHGEVSREMFAHLWPGVPEQEVPVGSVTNGVHGPTWVSREMSDLFDSQVGFDWHVKGADDWARIVDADNHAIWSARVAGKQRLVETVRDQLQLQLSQNGGATSGLEWVQDALDPSILTIGFARRMATYKRAALLLSQPERLKALLSDPERPVQFVFAGKSHPADDQGKELIRQIFSFASQIDVRHRFVFVEDYDMAIARALVQGCDVWLNTPVRPMEASGTSGEKAVLNGSLHCSVLDGWWAECFVPGSDDTRANGWAIPSAEGVEDPARRLEIEANSLFELFETQLVPLYYEDVHDSIPHGWVERIKSSLTTLGPFVSSHRMVQDYVTDLYVPAAQRDRELSENGFEAARELARFHERLNSTWHDVHVDSVDTDESLADMNSTRTVIATVHPGSLSQDEIEVQLVVGSVGQSGELEMTEVLPMHSDGPVDGNHLRYRAKVSLSRPGRMGVTVRVVPCHPRVREPLEFGMVAWP
ncbi:MAG: alpha-glucan family phosphorylase [Microthrixaceae bacterium]